MKTIIGISDVRTEEDIRSLVEDGAEEFFIGYVPREWSEVFGWEVSCNRRENSSYHYRTVAELENVVGLIHAQGKKVYLTLNAHEYTEAEIELAFAILQTIAHVPIDAYIIGNLALMLYLRERGVSIPFHVSIAGGCNNIETMLFYHETVTGIKRFILPRKLTVREIGLLSEESKKYGFELEAFGFHDNCMYNDEYCFGWHGDDAGSFCHSKMNSNTTIKAVNRGEFQIGEHFKRTQDIHNKIRALREKMALRTDYGAEEFEREFFLSSNINGCGLCAIQKFKEFGIASLKVPARGKENLKTRNFILKQAKKAIDYPNADPEFCKGLL